MPLEVGNTIETLDDTWPLGGDPTLKGDDHLRLIKNVLKNIFPGSVGNGFNTPITATEAELNALGGVTGNVQTRLNSLESSVTTLESAIAELNAPSGTRMVFSQAAAPAGWTQDTSRNDYMMRVVSGAGNGIGGSDSPILNNKVPSHTHGATVNDPGHSHSIAAGNDDGSSGQLDRAQNFQTNINTASSTTGISVSIAANSGASNWTPKYVNMIVCSKD